ncbi:Holliday junction resolvase RuvX [Nitrospirillum sp. BR 11164]|uniref:Holliday junction resolvase RuvX n=1 Tax=Nitrospirillum sp. BR 11164 TaxID=3104324 RepID=UPI002AFFDAA1|nr:Holliday junction resolvase RuvX [Nitrospirillum sp. BR 11164]MEA1652495.1 Holliday junction resolvase RuvX [Nitrospirillum sp. BR 11164]
MAIRNIRDLKAQLPPGGRLMGLDLGSKTIGMAISDPGLTVASPVGTIMRRKFTTDVQDLAKELRGRNVAGFVIGLPRNMDGSDGPAAQSARSFAQNLIEQPHLLGGPVPEIAFWDERLSTSAVSRMMIEWDMTRKRRDEVVDRMAAAYILQGALDFMAAEAARAALAARDEAGGDAVGGEAAVEDDDLDD